MRELKRVATRFDCAILIVHHTRKGADKKGTDDGNAEALSGAAAIVNLARRAIVPVPMAQDEAPKNGVPASERFRYLKLVDAKSNFARAADNPWYRLNSVCLPNAEPPVYPHGDNVQAIERVTLPLVMDAAARADDLKVKRALLDLIHGARKLTKSIIPTVPASLGQRTERSLLQDAIEVVRGEMAAGEIAAHPRSFREISYRYDEK